MPAGIILVIIGGIFLLNNMGFIGDIRWDIIWPIILIVFGLNMMQGGKWLRGNWKGWEKKRKEGGDKNIPQ